jgi:DNA-directed RNA polymerase specialized sigma24 family protein
MDLVEACLLRQRAAAIRGAITALPARDASLVHQRHLLGQSYREIAAEAGMTVSHVGVALHRAAARLRNHLWREHGDLFPGQ